MKRILTTLALSVIALTTYAQTPTYVNGYITSSGQYVEGHYRTTPNQTRNDNYSTRPNVNPFTGEVGTKPRDEDGLDRALRQQSQQTPTINYNYPTYTAPSVPTYQTYSAPAQSQPVYVGPRGGIYHLSPSGNKVYH